MLGLKWVGRSTLVLMLLLGLAACGGKPAATPQVDAATLAAKFKDVADAAQQERYHQADVVQLGKISQALADLGPGGLDKLLELLSLPETHPRTKMLITMNVKSRLTQENMPRIVELTDAKYEVNTRVNAAYLVGSYNEPLLVPRSAELLKDPEPRVRMASFQVQLLRGTPEAMAMVDAIWNAPDTPIADKGQIVNSISEADAPKFMAIYANALSNPEFDPIARGRAITILGRIGGADALPALDKAAAEELDAGLKDQAKVAADALRSRLGLPIAATPAPAAETSAASAETPAVPAS